MWPLVEQGGGQMSFGRCGQILATCCPPTTGVHCGESSYLV